jgi:hypothetical protein
MSRNAARWIFRLDRNYSWNCGVNLEEDVICRDAQGKVRLIIEADGKLTVTAGYAWNGCSPKICVFDIVVGTPDGVTHTRTGMPKTYFASLVHDALYQFMGSGSPITRAQADGCFLRLMTESEFAPRRLFWLAVRALGGLVWRGKRYVRKWQGEVVPVRMLGGDLRNDAGQDPHA